MPLSAPTPTWTSRALIRLMDVTMGWSRHRAIIASVTLFAIVVAVDSWFGAAFYTHFLCFAACAFAVWCVGGRSGMLLSMAGASAAVAIEYFEPSRLLGSSAYGSSETWGLASLLLSFAIFVATVSGLRDILVVNRWRASHDGLTGVLNKTGFEEEAARAIARVQDRNRDLLLVFMDLDGFKEVNDRYGHAAGDTVLRAFATAASDAIRPTDLFARFGGDEFAALLTLPREVDGGRIAEIVHQRFTEILVQTGFDVTCSMGATVMAGEDACATGMMEEVDGLMYEVKRSGKNGLRLGRGTPLTRALRAAFPPLECDDLSGLLQRIDMADRGLGWSLRSVA